MLISLVTPTHDRPEFIQTAAKYFKWQTYHDLEWIIVEDGEGSVQHLLPHDPRIKYFHVDGEHFIGSLRNLCAEHASGELIMHHDDDDAYAPFRVQHQLDFHLKHGKAVSGIGSLVLHDVTTDVFTRYNMAYPYSSGCSLTYSKAFWNEHRFGDEAVIAEDTDFLTAAKRFDQVAPDNSRDVVPIVALTHPRNHCGRDPLYRTSDWSYEAKPDWYGAS